MTRLFSGSWKIDNSALNIQLLQLKKAAYQEFDIEISIEKMTIDASYRQLVISELSQLKCSEIDKILQWLTTTKNTVAKVKISSNSLPEKKTQKTKVLSTVVVLFSIIASLFFISTNFHENTVKLVNESKINNSTKTPNFQKKLK